MNGRELYQLLIVITIIFQSCGAANTKEVTEAENLPTNPIDSIAINDELPSKLNLLLEVALNETRNQKFRDTLMTLSPDTIPYLNSFDLSKVDSLKIFGYAKDYVKYRLPQRTLFILYYHDEEMVHRELDSLDTHWRNRFDDVESMFKSGGMAFELDGQLALFQLDACAANFSNVERVDSLIQEKVFEGQPYHRLLARCGMGPFVKKNH